MGFRGVLEGGKSRREVELTLGVEAQGPAHHSALKGGDDSLVHVLRLPQVIHQRPDN